MSTVSPLRRIDWLPKLVLAPSFVAAFLFIYGLIAWNGYLSVTESHLLPNYEFAGLDAYRALMDSDRFHVAAWNLVTFAVLFIAGSLAVGARQAMRPECWAAASSRHSTVFSSVPAWCSSSAAASAEVAPAVWSPASSWARTRLSMCASASWLSTCRSDRTPASRSPITG